MGPTFSVFSCRRARTAISLWEHIFHPPTRQRWGRCRRRSSIAQVVAHHGLLATSMSTWNPHRGMKEAWTSPSRWTPRTLFACLDSSGSEGGVVFKGDGPGGCDDMGDGYRPIPTISCAQHPIGVVSRTSVSALRGTPTRIIVLLLRRYTEGI